MFLTEKLLFIHIPKSAGSSVVKLLEEEIGGIKKFEIDIHSTFNQFQSHYPGLVKDKKVFCLVRNPYCRFVSIYRFINRDLKLKKWFGDDFLQIKSKIDTFDKFINNFVFPDWVWNGNDHFTPQCVWAENVQNIFQVEKPDLINEFLKDNGVLQNLPLTNNREPPSHNNFMYRDYYNSDTKKLIRDKFEKDLNNFNYDF